MHLGKIINRFIHLEASGGIALFVTAVLALIIDNSPWSIYYHQFFSTHFSLQFGHYILSKPVLLWINDGFMDLFFLLVGLEIKRELFEGELNSFSKAILPGVAALGGMIIPAIIYIGFNFKNAEALRGWAIPTATDIAFSLGILSLLGKRIPPAIKIFLMALAIFDDIGAIIIIAIFYNHGISVISLILALILIGCLVILNRLRITSYLPYFILGAILWLCVLKSGVHATLSGIVLAFTIPLRDPAKPNYLPAAELIKALHPWVAFGILPLFAFANAGVSFEGLTLAHFLGPISLGIGVGLFLGKQLGIWGFSMLAVKCKIAKLPANVSPWAVYGVGLIGGVGFTMSLFIGTLAFEYGKSSSMHAAMVRTGVLAGSLLAGLSGYILLRFLYRSKAN
ncbi:MAG: Na+/H+ antiporter NhaA [Proteobacteria bacterium]|nr:Na+/H+ antiporter NhaA [Pseudomonadota bacterium]